MFKTITIEEAKSLTEAFSQRPQEDQKALCCLLGAYAGDNLGNYNEFSYQINDEDLESAMKMPGAGTHNLIPGQCTDDTELATSMGYGLIENPDPNILDFNLISKYYALWLKSPPFDLGNTIGAALSINRQTQIKLESTAEECKKLIIAQRNRLATRKSNKHSESNGGCMRITPLCVYLSKQTDQNLIRRIVYAEQTLTHISEASLESAYVYVRLVVNLIRGATAQQAYTDLEDYFKNECKQQQVKQWWDLKQTTCEFDDVYQNMGWVKHALTQCFVVLKRLSDQEKQEDFKRGDIYQKYIKSVLKLCGDSDTNCAIVGGMLGAYLTLEDFPKNYLWLQITCNLQDKTDTRLLHPRDPIYNPRNCIYLCDEILKKANFDENIQIIDEKLLGSVEDEINKQNEERVKKINEEYYKRQQELENQKSADVHVKQDQEEKIEEEDKKQNLEKLFVSDQSEQQEKKGIPQDENLNKQEQVLQDQSEQQENKIIQQDEMINEI